MTVRTAPTADANVDYSSAPGLTDAYAALRASARALATDLQINLDEFDTDLPELKAAAPMHHPSPEGMIELSSQASTAATRLRTLRGYLEGLIAMTAVTADLTPSQVEIVRSVVSS